MKDGSPWKKVWSVTIPAFSDSIERVDRTEQVRQLHKRRRLASTTILRVRKPEWDMGRCCKGESLVTVNLQATAAKAWPKI
jgi:poly-beta-hydroxyalkanoate depolymerase